MNTLRTAIGLSLLVGLSLSGCGGSSSSTNDLVALCKQSCTKSISLCFADAGAAATPFKTLCESECTSAANSAANSGTSCTNSAAVIAAVKACQAEMTCTAFQSCTAMVPACTGGGSGGHTGAGTGGGTGAGTGGTTGAGTGGRTAAGTGGAGGTSGAGATCADLTACCAKVTNASVKLACSMEVSTAMAQVASGTITQAEADQGCAQALAAGQAIFCP